MKHLKTGKRGEELAIQEILKAGCTILQRNYRCKFGEIDIIIKEPSTDTIVFLEVKTRTNSDYGDPWESIDYRKRQRVKRAAIWYARENKLHNTRFRFDVFLIDIPQDTWDIKWYKDAFR